MWCYIHNYYLFKNTPTAHLSRPFHLNQNHWPMYYLKIYPPHFYLPLHPLTKYSSVCTDAARQNQIVHIYTYFYFIRSAFQYFGFGVPSKHGRRRSPNTNLRVLAWTSNFKCKDNGRRWLPVGIFLAHTSIAELV